MVVAAESFLYHSGEVATLGAGLIDGDAHGSQSWQVHQQVIDEISEPTIIMSADDGAECHAVGTSQRVVADKGIEFTVFFAWKVLHSLYLERHVEVTHTLLEPFCAREVPTVPQITVDLILMDDMFQPSHKRFGNEFCLCSHLVGEYFINIDGTLCYLFHFSLIILTECKSNRNLRILILFVIKK